MVEQGKQDKTAELDALVNKMHDLSQYLGDEMVIVALKQSRAIPDSRLLPMCSGAAWLIC